MPEVANLYFPVPPPPHPEVCTQSPPPPPPPALYTRLASRSAREGHNSCSIGEGARLLPPGSRKSRERRVGEGSPGPGLALRVQASPSPGADCSGKGQVCSGRKPPSQTEASFRERRAGGRGELTTASRLPASRYRALGPGRLEQRVFRERRRHCARGFPRAPRRGGRTKAARGPTPAGGEGPASLRALGSRRLLPRLRKGRKWLSGCGRGQLCLCPTENALREVGSGSLGGGVSWDLKKGLGASSPGPRMGGWRSFGSPWLLRRGSQT